MKNDGPIKLANFRMLQFVADKLQELSDEVVFLGGCTTALFITDIASPDVRYTLDVDCIVDVISLRQYHQLESRLQHLGFKKALQDDVICRWRYDDVILDVMPTDEKILGFGNRWYKAAIEHAKDFQFSDTLRIKVVTAPYFLATKLEAFKGRGNMDFLASHDLEDIISVLDGRLEINDEIMQSNVELKKYLASTFAEMEKNAAFHDALPGHFTQYGSLSGERIELLLAKINKISEFS